MGAQELRGLFLREFTAELIRNVNLVPRIRERYILASAQQAVRAESPAKIAFAPRVVEFELPGKKTAGEEIEELIANPEVKSIECPGAGKNLILIKRGRTEPVGLALSSDEIKNYLQKISQKTKVPFGESGLFKAEVGNLVITAIVSEFIGTRFVITKKFMT